MRFQSFTKSLGSYGYLAPNSQLFKVTERLLPSYIEGNEHVKSNVELNKLKGWEVAFNSYP